MQILCVLAGFSGRLVGSIAILNVFFSQRHSPKIIYVCMRKVESVQQTQPKHGHLRCKCKMLQPDAPHHSSTNMSLQDRFHITLSRLRLRAVSRRAFAGLLPKMPPVPIHSLKLYSPWRLGDYFSLRAIFRGCAGFWGKISFRNNSQDFTVWRLCNDVLVEYLGSKSDIGCRKKIWLVLNPPLLLVYVSFSRTNMG